MRPFRLFTIVAGSVGLAIAAGTLFQPDPNGAPDPRVANPAPETTSPGPTLAGGVPSLVTVMGRTAPTPDTAPETAPETAATSQVPGSSQPPLVAAVTEFQDEADATPGLPVLATGSGPVPDVAELLAEADACAAWLVVTPEPAAMLDLSLFAPCNAGETVTIAHGPLRLDSAVGPDGRVVMALPALSAVAEVTLTLGDGRVVTDRTDVPDFGMFPRVVVQWDGPQVLDLHAYVGGATWGEPGHVQAGGPVSAVSGFVTALPTRSEAQARIYTFPAGVSPQDGLILLEGEVAVTEASCGRTFEARVQLVRDDAPISRRDIRVDMPACDMPDGFVLLPDLLPESLPGLAALN
jgi:hypothetical protein